MKNERAIKNKATIQTTQKNLPIAEIKNDTIIFKDGTLRAIFMVSSINFALKNEDEQEALVNNYVAFLNSLDHPLQVVIQSRQLNIAPYLNNLLQREREQPNELLRMQIADYRSFIGELVSLGKIMSKNFFVVVPYNPLSNKKRSFFARFKDVVNPANVVKLKEKVFLRRKHDLDLRMRHVETGLRGMGLEVARLDTQSLIEVIYSTYNPDIAMSESLSQLSDYQIENN
jgi:hypothetical protein